MSKALISLLIAMGALLFVPSVTRAQGLGVVQGKIVNGTAGGSSVGGLEVELRTFQANNTGGETAEVDRLKTKADAQGQFRFEGLSTATGNVYQVVANYQDVTYSGQALQFESGSENLTAELSVYETTTDDGAIATRRAHLLVSPAEAGVSVTELYLLENSGDRTYIGQQQVQGRRWTSSYQLPAGARNVVFEDGTWGGRFLETKGGLVDTEPLWPGQTTVIFAYTVDCSSGPCDLGRTLQQGVSNINVLVPDSGMAISSGTLAQQENLDVQGKSYLNFAASNLAPATALDLQIAPAVGAPFSGPSRPAPKNSSVIPWIILGVVVMGVFLGYPFWRRRVQQEALRDRS